jgi:hypothetical protein
MSVPDDLPLLPADHESLRRTTGDVAVRAMCLCICAVKGEGMKHGDVERTVLRYGVADALSPAEHFFLHNRAASPIHRVEFSWRYESYWVLLWALRFVESLPWPDTICDVRRACLALRDRTRDEFLADAELRPQPEILDAADANALVQWVCTESRRRKLQPPADVDPHVVRERHAAFTWLIGPSERAWDESIAGKKGGRGP